MLSIFFFILILSGTSSTEVVMVVRIMRGTFKIMILTVGISVPKASSHVSGIICGPEFFFIVLLALLVDQFTMGEFESFRLRHVSPVVYVHASVRNFRKDA
jgi:hypothetical protein